MVKLGCPVVSVAVLSGLIKFLFWKLTIAESSKSAVIFLIFEGLHDVVVRNIEILGFVLISFMLHFKHLQPFGRCDFCPRSAAQSLSSFTLEC